MIGEKAAKRLIACGWIAAGTSGLLTAILAYNRTGGLNPLNLIDAVLLMGLACGIYCKSRLCALAALLYYVANQIMRLKMIPASVPMVNLLAPIAIFVGAYLLGVAGTFVWHAQRGLKAA
jgi:hypothetical protein